MAPRTSKAICALHRKAKLVTRLTGLLLVAACASVTDRVEVLSKDASLVSPAKEDAALLEKAPQRDYEEVARLRVRGRPGEALDELYGELRSKAAELGADAVVLLDEEKRYRELPGGDPQAGYAIGNAYPRLLTGLEDTPLPGPGYVQIGGVYYEIYAAAIRYSGT